tara:strand:- start:216 stop:485 length:270 start_codon:yes stop_codon:yes gene_type:complete
VNKAKYITGEYATEFRIDIDELGIKEENVKDWYINCNCLHVLDNNDVWTEHSLDLDSTSESHWSWLGVQFLRVVDENWQDSEWAGRTTD